jgi:transposase
MTIFKSHKIGVNELLGVIPEALLSHLSENTKVDYYSKVLHGKKLFYLLMYGILENARLSQRTLEDTFNDPVFKLLFDLDQGETVCRSSISERLSKIDFGFFKQIYECIYEQFSELYTQTDQLKYNLIRVDSTIVFETSNKLAEGISQNHHDRKAVKYTMAFDGILPCLSETFTASTYSSEETALPEAVLNHVKQEKDHSNIYILDRGLQSTRTMSSFNKEHAVFIVRSKENRKHVEIKSFIGDDTSTDLGNLTLLKDSLVHLYTGKPINNKRGNMHYREELVEEPFRLIITKSKEDESKEFWFITNELKLPAKEITDAYRRRWDIEVFFRFIKQELNVSHLISLNRNGIQVMIYMSLIVAMLILIYKHANNIGYKTAKRRFNIEIRNLIISMIVVECGGNPSIFFNKLE